MLNPSVNADPTAHRVRFSGVDLQLVNGTGQTDTVNGRGNLILGYDLARDDGTSFCSDGQFIEKGPCERVGQTWAVSHKTGSHYVVIGDRNNYSPYGGLVVGAYNSSTGPGASVSGGRSNTARGSLASVSGGSKKTASGHYASVTGGQNNTASADAASVSGGRNLNASGRYGWVAGPLANP